MSRLCWINLLLSVTYLSSANCYNVDVLTPIIIENPDTAQKGSYFGYSLALYGSNNTKWIKIGAPKANYNGLNESGVIYHCPYKKSCYIEERLGYQKNNLSYAWTGAAMDIDYANERLAVSAVGWKNPFNRDVVKRGAVFVQDIKKNGSFTIYSPLRNPLTEKSIAYYIQAITGLSLQFVKNSNELLVGAPGVYNFMGTPFKITNLDRNNWDYVISEQLKGNYYEYSGYAVTSGRFRSEQETLYATGMPRGYSTYYKGYQETEPYVQNGMVAIYSDLTHGEQHYEFTGTQMGEYFGFSLIAGDLNMDGLDDLIVGAPYRMNDKSGYNHGSVYVIYGDKKEPRLLMKNRIDGMVAGAMFGTSLMVLDGLLQDVYPELAISAINEDDSGVVYLYSYSLDHRTPKLLQKIVGKQLYPKMRGFGMSLSRAEDIDDNNYKDFAIGSPLSGHAVILRTRPIVTVIGKINVRSTIKRANDTLQFKCCYYYQSEAFNKNFTIMRTITVDSEHQRFSFDSNKDGMSNNKSTIDIVVRQEKCEFLTVYKKVTNKNVLPVVLNLTYEIAELRHNPLAVVISPGQKPAKDGFCRTCPIMKKNSKSYDIQVIAWDLSCVHDGRSEECVAELEVNARFLDLKERNTYPIGSTTPLRLEVTVDNRGDRAPMELIIKLPSGVILAEELVDCQSSDGVKITCTAGEHIRVNYILKLFVVADEPDTNLHFSFNASTIIRNRNERSSVSLPLKLKIEAYFRITGTSNESTYIYDKQQPTLIANIFKIEKSGPSPTDVVPVNIMVPYESANFEKEKILFNEVFVQNDTLVKCQIITEELKKRAAEFTAPIPPPKETLIYINCSKPSIKCALIKCWVGPFDARPSYAEIKIGMKADFKLIDGGKYDNWLEEIDQLLLLTEASVNTDYFRKIGDTSSSTVLANVVLVIKDHQFPWWIVIGALVLSLIILIVLVICLKKAGFFERKKHEMLLQLKEEALQEDKLVEEILQQELEATHEPFPVADLAYSYLQPQALQDYLKRAGKIPANAEDPLLEPTFIIENDMYHKMCSDNQ